MSRPGSSGGAAGAADNRPLTVHASTVACERNGQSPGAVLITGPSGSGKSSLALCLMALGARLIADDQTILIRDVTGILTRAPAATRGLIEARGVGLLHADPLPEAALVLVIDLGQIESDRLPPFRSIDLLGLTLPLLHKVEYGHFPAAILHYILAGRSA